MAKTTIQIVHDKEVAADIAHHFIATKFTSKMHLVGLQKILHALANGIRNGAVTTIVDDSAGVAASGTITFSNFNTVADQIIVNGQTFAAVASGATGLQFNVAGSASLQAASVVSAINASSALVGVVSAAAVGAVVTITSFISGPIGNAVTLAKGTDVGTVMTVAGVSNGRLSLGSVATVQTLASYKFGV